MSEPRAAPGAATPARRRRWGRLLLLALNAALLALLAYWFATNIRPAVFARHFSLIPAWAILVSLLINLATIALYGLRLASILGGGFARSFCIVNIGYGLNAIMPLRLGEAAKIVLAYRIYHIPATRLVMGAFLEKLFDLCAVVLLGLILVAFGATRYAGASALLAPAIVVLGAFGGLLALRPIAAWTENALPESNRLRQLLLDLHGHSRDYPLHWIGLLTILIWLMNVAGIYFAFSTYLGDIGFTALDAVAMLVILALAVAVPSTPGSIGLFEAVVVAYLTQFLRVQQEAALAAAVVSHLALSLPQIVLLLALVVRYRVRIFGWEAARARSNSTGARGP